MVHVRAFFFPFQVDSLLLPILLENFKNNIITNKYL